MQTPELFTALVVSEVANLENEDESRSPRTEASIQQFAIDDLDLGDVLVRIAFSALNYKDGLAARGNSGVVRKLPMIPGIDAVGEVVASEVDHVKLGDQVLIAHAKFGTAHHGGFASFAKVPADWVYVLPSDLSMEAAVAWGTAGFTAAQSVEQLIAHSVDPDSGDVLVTGSTGGVGIFAVNLLAKLGYRVVASTGKKEKHDWLRKNGAAEIVERSETVDDSGAPMLKGRWAGVIDTVGGSTLATAIRSCQPHACVTACGLVAGHKLDLTVYPFILRGVTLCGIDSANISRETRLQLWNKIASQWRINIDGLVNEVSLDQLPGEIEKILEGQVFGRTVVRMGGD